ncbi:Peroxisomal membrane protein PAS20 [Actinomortierella ambigua]|uniref:Peroxisomal membrane protein PEX13 n=1 Tax=Actinomortierella ambigua TaxID=1343610 RepID=A0A9P6PYQ2_9FUNG|nr:Peroxisomal membrane protein PAS20 [Actinomortierella ambigua]
MASPPKPWERAAGVSAASTTSAPLPAASAPIVSPAAATSLADTSSPPALPARNANMMGTTTTSSAYRPGMSGMSGYGTSYGSGMNSYSSGYSGYGGTGGYGSSYSSPYNRMGYGSSYGGYNSYSSPYSRMGMYGSSYGSSYGGGYGGGYGGYGMNRMGMGMNGMNPMNPEELSLMQRMEQGSAPTFQLIESVVGAFGGFAQMLESTFMATHSSFMAMVGVAEQFGHLRSYLGQILSVFALLRWAKSLLYRLIGKKMPVNAQELTPGNFQEFQARPRLSKRPIVLFLLAVIGLPYLMGRLIRALSRQPEIQQQQQEQQQQQIAAGGQVVAAPVNPQNLDFARALYDFQASGPQELSFRRGDIIAILSRHDPLGQESQWWRGRLRSGEMGLFPSNYVEIINKGNNNNNNSNNPASAPTPAGAPTNAPAGLPGAPGAPLHDHAAKAASQTAVDLQAALAGSAFEKFEF